MSVAYASLGEAKIVSSSVMLNEFAVNGLDYSAFYRRANSYSCSIGPEPGVAWLLMKRSEIKKLDSRQSHNLTFGVGDKSVVIKNLAIIHAQRIVSGKSLSPDAVYLVQLVDVRWLLRRTFINSRYNIRETCSASGWCQDTLNAGTPWTFEEICEDIWSNFSSFGGFFTGNSTWDASKFHEIAATVDPENVRFEGVTAWDALAQLCQESGFFLRYDPTVGDIRIMKIGLSLDPSPGSDGDLHAGFGGGGGAFDAAESIKFALTPDSTARAAGDSLTDDSETILGAPIVPASVNVVFPTNDASCGSFCDINGSHGWYYKVNVTSTAARASMTGDTYLYMDHYVSGTSVILNSTTFARFDAATDVTPSNQSDLEALAEQIAIDYYTSIGVQANGRVVFGGIKNFVPGPYISEVTWRDWGDGFRTEVARWPSPVGIAKPQKVPTGGSSNPCDMVRFQILVADSATRSALCHIMARPYGCDEADVPGTVLDGLGIEVCDPSGCFLNESEDLLVGREGWAKYVTPISGGSFCQDGNYYIAAEWEVFSLCCAVFNCDL